MAGTEIQWQAPEFEYREKDLSWYWLTIIAAVLFLGFAVWQRNFLFAFFVIVAEILILVWGERNPKSTNFSVGETGIQIGTTQRYTWKDMDRFSLGEHVKDGSRIVQIYLKGRLRPTLVIQVPSDIEERVLTLFRRSTREVEHRESLVDSLEKLTSF